MHTPTLSFLLRVLPLLLVTPSALAATCTWQGGSGTWATASAWSCGAVPGANDDVVVGSGTVTLAVNAQVRDLTLTGGTIDGVGDLAIGRALVWEAGTMGGSGTTTVASATTLRTATAKNVGRRVVVHGATTWSDGTLQMRDGGVFVNEGVFTDNAVGSHSIARAGTITTEPLVVNRGDWRVQSGGTNLNVDFANEGGLVVAGAGLDVNSPGRFTNMATGTLIGTALLDVSSGPTVSVGGTTRPGGAIPGSFPVRGSFPMTSDHVLDVDLRGGPDNWDRLLVEDGTVTVDGRLLVRISEFGPIDAGATVPVLSHTGSGAVVGCYGPEDVTVVEPDGVTAAPYAVSVACTSDGITLTVTAASTAGEDDPTGSGGMLAVTGANPFSGRTTLAFTAPTLGHVTVDAFDALGRRVAVLFDGLAPAGQPVAVAFEGGALPAGLYVVRATGDGIAVSQTVTRAR